jgi:hypothetical protein
MVAKVQQVVAEHADRDRTARQAAEQAAALSAQLNAVPTTGTLKALRQSMECVTTVQCPTERTQSLKNRKESELRQAITALETFAADLDPKLAVVRTGKEAAKLRNAITERRLFYADTPEAQGVEQALVQCECVERLLNGLAAFASPSFRTVSEKAECEQRLASLRGSVDGCLSGTQMDLFGVAEQKVRDRAELLTRQASEWLTQMQSRAQNLRDADRLLEELRRAPEFLPEERRHEIAAIATQVQKGLDQDVCINIRRLFNKITDVDTRVRLLDELQVMVREGQQV